MVNLTAINTTKKAYANTGHELLLLGIFQDKKLNQKQSSLNTLLENRLSRVIGLDRFTGKENIQVMIYGNDSIKRIIDSGVPVMGHLGLTPQSIYKFGTYSVRAKEKKEVLNKVLFKN